MTLIDTGLLARYYIDEAASGTSPTSLVDASGNNYAINSINYDGTMAFTEDGSGNRGLVSSNVAGNHYALRNIDNTSDVIRDALVGNTKGTLEVVLTLVVGNSNGGRIFGINDRAGGNGQFTLKANHDGSTEIDVAFNGDNASTSYSIGTTRCVIHVVYDSTQATQNDRMRVYKDGTLIASVGTALSVGLNQGHTLGSNLDLILLNRNSGGSYQRSINGTVGYAAIYSVAFAGGDITNNSTDLLLDDDTPAAGGSSSPTGNVVRAYGNVPATGNGPVSYIFYPA